MSLQTKLVHRYEKYLCTQNEQVKRFCSMLAFVFNLTDMSKLAELSRALGNEINTDTVLFFFPDLDLKTLDDVIKNQIDYFQLEKNFDERQEYLLSEMTHYLPHQTRYEALNYSLAHLLGSKVMLYIERKEGEYV